MDNLWATHPSAMSKLIGKLWWTAGESPKKKNAAPKSHGLLCKYYRLLHGLLWKDGSISGYLVQKGKIWGGCDLGEGINN